MKRACSRCRKEHRACKGGVPCRRCVALRSPERCHNNDDDIEQKQKQDGLCSRQANSPSITTPTKQKPKLGGQGQILPQFKKPHQCGTPSSSSSSSPPQRPAMYSKGKQLTRRQGNPGHLSSIPLSADQPKKRKRSFKKEKHLPTIKSAKVLLEATQTASAKTDTAGSTSSRSPGCTESAPAAQLHDPLASLVAQVHQLSDTISCIQEEQNLMRMQVRSLQDEQSRIQLEAASIRELSHQLAHQRCSTAYPQGVEPQRLPPLPFLDDQTKGFTQYEQPLAPPSTTTAPFFPPDLQFLEPPTTDNLPTPVFKQISMPSYLWTVPECPLGMTPRDITAYPQQGI
jgi:hypothetical protein